MSPTPTTPDPLPLHLSRSLAWVFGIIIPVAETIRRWGTGGWGDPPAWIDDYLIGAFLLIAACHSTHDPVRGRACLAAAWAFCCGMLYSSFFLHRQHAGEPDPGNFPQLVIASLGGIGLALSLPALVLTLISNPSPRETPR